MRWRSPPRLWLKRSLTQLITPQLIWTQIREAVVGALDNASHNTAAVLLNGGKWSMEGDTIRVEVGIKKTMLELTMNIEAEKIAKNALRAMGASQKLVVVPGENGAASPDSKPRVGERVGAGGSVGESPGEAGYGFVWG